MADAHSWHRREGESGPAYEALRLYLDLGASRSLRAVGQKLGKSRALIDRWSSCWDWSERAASYDAFLYVQAEVAKEKALKSEAEKWARRQLEAADQLFEKAQAMLEWPLARRVTKDGQTIIEPVRWGMRDAGTLADTAIKLARLALGQATDVQKTVLTTEDAREKLAAVLGVRPDELPDPRRPPPGSNESEGV